MEETYPPPDDSVFQDINPEQIFPDLEAGRIIKHMVCGRCHGHLNQYPTQENRMWVILCDTCGIGRGFVSRKYAESVSRMNQAAAMEIRYAARQFDFAELVGLEKPKTADELLREIGFA